MTDSEIRYIISARARTQLWDALDDYFKSLESSQLAAKSIEDYYYFAECFVRWIDGTFIPGHGRQQ
jgi:hypothetical protein